MSQPPQLGPPGFNPQQMTPASNSFSPGPQKTLHTPIHTSQPTNSSFSPTMNPTSQPMTPDFPRMPLGPPPLGMKTPPVPQPFLQKSPVVNGTLGQAQSNGFDSNSSSRQESPTPSMARTSSQQSINSIAGPSTTNGKTTPSVLANVPPNANSPSTQMNASPYPSGPSFSPFSNIRPATHSPHTNNLQTPHSQATTGQAFRFTPQSTGQSPTNGPPMTPIVPASSLPQRPFMPSPSSGQSSTPSLPSTIPPQPFGVTQVKPPGNFVPPQSIAHSPTPGPPTSSLAPQQPTSQGQPPRPFMSQQSTAQSTTPGPPQPSGVSQGQFGRPVIAPQSSSPMRPAGAQCPAPSNFGMPNQKTFGPPIAQNQFQPPRPGVPPSSFGPPPMARMEAPVARPPTAPGTQGASKPPMRPGGSYPRIPPPTSQSTLPAMTGVPSMPIRSPGMSFNAGATGPPQSFGAPPRGPTTHPPRPPLSGAPNFQKPPTSPFIPSSAHPNQTVSSQPTSGQSFNANHYMAQPTKPTFQQVSQQFSGMSVTQDGWNKGWGTTPVDLLQHRTVLPPGGDVPPKPLLMQDNLQNCSPDIFRCTLTRIPETSSVLQKSRMPFGILIHPYRDLEHLPVVNCSLIVRCRSCRTYINPFIVFKSERRWECNLCFKVNELPEEFQYDPLTRTYGDPSRRPEVREATIEFIAPAEYMLRPPQPAAYIYVLDVSRQAVDTGYLHVVCRSILEHLDEIPGDTRMLLAFITYSKTLQFYLLGEEQNTPCMLEVGSIDEVFLPFPQDLLVNARDCRSLVEEFLTTLPDTHANTPYTESCLGAALQAAYKLLAPIGGRITVMVNTLPTLGPGALKPREDPNQRSAKEISHLGPATDFYKKFALDCSGQQIAVDLFTVNSQYVDLSSLSGISKFSGGCINHFPNFSIKNTVSVQSFKSCFTRYLTRKLGMEAVMRIRATRGLAITNFHGNFFVRSTDLLSLPNINPDAGFGMQVTVEESLHNIRYACFQAALLYTSSKGERRIRVHTMCLPVTGNVHEVVTSVDQQCMIGFLAKLAVDRCLTSQMSDAREAVINACCDALSAFKNSQSVMASGLPAPQALKLVPLYCLALLKSVALRHGVCTKLDDRVFAMCEMKTMPLGQLMLVLYPDLFPIHDLSANGALTEEDLVIPQPGRIHLSAEFVDRSGAYLMDAGTVILVYVRSFVDPSWISDVIGVPNYAAIPQPLNEDPLPPLDNPRSEMLRNFVAYRQRMKAYNVPVWVLKEDNPERQYFTQRLVDDRSEGSHSYVEFVQYIRSQIK